MTVDLNLIESGYDIWAMAEYMDEIEERIPYLVDQDRIRTEADLKELGPDADEADRNDLWQRHYHKSS